jgi:hypothetical protein
MLGWCFAFRLCRYIRCFWGIHRGCQLFQHISVYTSDLGPSVQQCHDGWPRIVMVSLGDSTYWLWVIFSTNTLVSDRRSISPPLMVKNFRYALDFRWVLPVLMSLRSCACFRPMILSVETTYRVAYMIVQTQHLMPICVEDGQANYLHTALMIKCPPVQPQLARGLRRSNTTTTIACCTVW